jgi:hypothetical protein
MCPLALDFSQEQDFPESMFFGGFSGASAEIITTL